MVGYIIGGAILLIIGLIVWKAFSEQLIKWLGIALAAIGLILLAVGIVYLISPSALLLLPQI